jgi:probable rRNA maturation factor
MTTTVVNRQRKVRVDVAWLRKFAACAIVQCREFSDDKRFALKQLEEVEIAIVSDKVIAAVHEQFMNIPGATDVITFEHGEIVMSAETAASYAGDHRHSVEQELALYTVHGMLHLNGFEDATSEEAARMHRVQDRIWKECLGQLPPPHHE